MDLISGQTLVKADGSKVQASTALTGKNVICLYFSAHWCPPCRGFTPVLKKFYDEVKNSGVEIIFVSADQSHNDMISYMKESHGEVLIFSKNKSKKYTLKIFEKNISR